MILALLLACSGAPSDSGDTGQALEPTLTNVQAEIFDASCAFSSCHGSGTGAGGLSLVDGGSHAALVGVESTAAAGEILVVAGDSAASYLVKKCSAAEGIVGEPMPEGQDEGLDVERLALLTAWIDAGAADD